MTRRQRRALALASCLVAATGGANVWAESAVTVELGHGTVHVGDRVSATITLRADPAPSGEPRFPAWGDRWGEADIVTAGAVERVAEGVYRQQLVLTPFSTGTLKLPPQTVEVPVGDRTEHLTTPADTALEVASLLPVGDAKPEPKPPAPPRALPLGQRFWWTAAIGGALCLLAGTLVFLRRRADAGGAADSTVPLLAPLPELVAEIEALAALGAALAGEPAHTRLSLALRRFLGRSLGIHALESSTSEIRAALREHGLPRAAATDLLEVLRACDGVKFARRPATADEATARLDRARRAATDIATAMAPPAASADGAAVQARGGAA